MFSTEDLISRVTARILSLHFPSLMNLLLGHTVTAHEETGCRNVAENAGAI